MLLYAIIETVLRAYIQNLILFFTYVMCIYIYMFVIDYVCIYIYIYIYLSIC